MSPPLPVRTRPLLAAGVVAVVSLGLPWGAGPGSGGGVPGAGPGTVPGLQLPVRALLALAVVLIWVAVHRSRPALARAGLALGALGLLTGLGGGILAGHLVYLVALLLTGWGLGVLPLRGRRHRHSTRSAPDTA
jgi:hypothetical protein